MRPAEAENVAWEAVDAAGGDYPEGYWLICQLLGQQNRWAEALGAFEQVKRTDRIPASDLLESARRADQAGESVLALRCLAAGDRPGPQQTDVLREQVRIAYLHGDHDLAYRTCERLTALEPDAPLPWVLLGRIDHTQGNFQKAIGEFRRALKNAPPVSESIGIREELIELLLGVGDLAAARTEIDDLRMAGTLTDAIRLHDAYLLRLEGKPTEAMEAVDELLEKGFAIERTRQLRGMLEFDRGDWASASEEFESVLQKAPRNKEVHFQLGQCLLRLGHPQEGADHLRIAEELTREATEILTLRDRVNQTPNDEALRKRLRELEERQRN